MEQEIFNLGKYMQCPSCKHEWATKSDSRIIKCSRCGKNNKNPYWSKP